MHITARVLLTCTAIMVGCWLVAFDDSPRASELRSESEPMQNTDSATVDWEVADSLNLPSPNDAARRSRFFTLLSAPTVVLTIPGLIVGPSTGFFYGGCPGRAWLGIGIRTAAVVGMASTFFTGELDFDPEDDETGNLVVMGVSGAVLVGSVIYDLATVRSTVEKNNNRRLQRALALVPEYQASSKTIGLRLYIGL